MRCRSQNPRLPSSPPRRSMVVWWTSHWNEGASSQLYTQRGEPARDALSPDVYSYESSLGLRGCTYSWSAVVGRELGGRAVDGWTGSGVNPGAFGGGGGGADGLTASCGRTRLPRRFLSRLYVKLSTISTTASTLMSRANSTNSKIVRSDIPSQRPRTPPQSDKYWVNCITQTDTHIALNTYYTQNEPVVTLAQTYITE